MHPRRHLAGPGRVPPHPHRGALLLHVPRLCAAVLGHGRGQARVAEGGALPGVSHPWKELEIKLLLSKRVFH